MAQEKDHILKLISNRHVLDIIELFNIDIDLDDVDEDEIEILTGEQISFEPSLHKPDFIVKIANIILMLEFQSTYLKIKDKKRFKVYIANFDLKMNHDNLKIIFAVVSTIQKSGMIEYSINEWDHFKFPLISLLDIDEKEIISNIRKKIDNQEEFSDKELIELSLTPMMVEGRENVIRQFEISTGLMEILKFPTEKIKETIYGISLMLVNMHFEKDDPMRKRIERDIMMKVDCIQEAIEEGIEKGEKRGEKKGKINLIKELLKDNEITADKAAEYLLSAKCEIKTVSKITKLPIQEIRKLTTLNR